MPSEGNSAAFKEFAWRFVNIIARTLVAVGRRPDYQQVRRYINDIESLFVEYARAHLDRHGAEDWKTQVNELKEAIKERNLPPALRGRNVDAIALMRPLVKKAVVPLLVMTWGTYLALPFSLHPTFVILPFATVFALTIAVTASTFKKYL